MEQVLTVSRPNRRQREFLECRKKYIAFGGARGGGKSWFVRWKAVLLALFFDKSAILCLVLAATITGCMHGVNLMLVCFVPRRFRKQGKVATMTGVCNACSYVGSTASSYGIAAIASALGWQKTLISWGLVALCGLVLCILIARRWTKFTKETEE